MGWIRRETEKGTTQYICPNCHDYHEFREDFGEQTFNANFIFCRRCGARNGTGTAPTLTPPNEPLTEEELQEMVGHPVWIKSARRKEWMLLWGCHGPEIYGRSFIFTRRTAQKEQLQFSELGVTWWPYRRPPEGEV